MVIRFQTSLSLGELEAPVCIVESTSSTYPRATATAWPTGKFGCTFECSVQTSRLDPGSQRVFIAIDGEPMQRDLANVTLLGEQLKGL